MIALFAVALAGLHVEALAQYGGAVWAGTFDDGLYRCAPECAAVELPARMINDLRAAPRGLYVAAAEGLFVSRDGRRFRREARVLERGVNRVAPGREWLWVSTPAVLYAIRLDDDSVVRRWKKPGGSTAVQAVTVAGSDVWLATEDCGLIRFRHERFEAFDRASGLPTSWFVDVAPAPDGGVFGATLRHGLVHLARDGTPREAPRGVDPWMLRLAPDGDALLAGTQGGLFLVRGEAAQPLAVRDARVHVVLRAGDTLLVGTESGLDAIRAP